MINIPIIEALKKHKDYLNADQMFDFSADTSFGNLNLNWIEILQRIDRVNDLIIDLYKEFAILKANHENPRVENAVKISDLFYRQKFLSEQIFYWLRKTADEIISLLYLLNYIKKHKHEPKKLNVSSIGEFLKSKTEIAPFLEKYRAYFEVLNEISNAFKHSFVNAQTHTYVGTMYPIVFALSYHHNNRNNDLKFKQYKFDDVLENYNSFLIETKIFLKSNY